MLLRAFNMPAVERGVAARAHRTKLFHLGLHDCQPSIGTAKRVLVCGDADMAYSLALESSLRAQACSFSLFTSTFEPEDELFARYPHAAQAMARLSERGVHVRCGVDARAILAHYGEGALFDRIVFNLPQSPPAPKIRNQIQLQRALLHDLCASAAAALAPGGEFWITLLGGQGGTHLDPIQRDPGHTWQVQHEAAQSGLLVIDVHRAEFDELEAAGYKPTGRGLNRTASLDNQCKFKGLVVHVLAKERAGEGNATEGSSDENGVSATPVSISPLQHSFDNCFWIDEAEVSHPLDAAAIHAIAATALEPEASHAIAEEPRLVRSYESPEDGRRALTYRFVYQSSVLALSKERALRLNARVCRALTLHGMRRQLPPGYPY